MSESAEGSAQVLAEALRAEAEAIERDPAASNDAAEVLEAPQTVQSICPFPLGPPMPSCASWRRTWLSLPGTALRWG